MILDLQQLKVLQDDLSMTGKRMNDYSEVDTSLLELMGFLGWIGIIETHNQRAIVFLGKELELLEVSKCAILSKSGRKTWLSNAALECPM